MSARLGCPNSFAGDTPVLMANGTQTPIDEVRVGDIVMAADPDARRTRPETVTALHKTDDDHDFVDVSVDGPPAGTKITTTALHRFWNAGAHDWVAAAKLRPGDRLAMPDGRAAVVRGVHRHRGAISTFNLTVSSLHTFFVVAGNVPVLVHNTGLCPHLDLGGVPEDLRPFAENVIRQVDKDGTLPPGVQQGGTRKKRGVYGGEGLPPQGEHYYAESDILPTLPGEARPEYGRLVFGARGEVWYTGHYKDGFVQLRGPDCGC
jgi:hypothetical protein